MYVCVHASVDASMFHGQTYGLHRVPFDGCETDRSEHSELTTVSAVTGPGGRPCADTHDLRLVF